MLGSFLEFSVATAEIQDSFGFYQRLGFSSAITNDIWSHPYGVLASGSLAIGLHAGLDPSPALTFVKPDVALLARQLQARGVVLTHRQLGAERFNEIGFTDAAGFAVRVLEARTFSPPPDLPDDGPLGRFERVSLPAADPDVALVFWRALDCLVWDTEADEWPRQVATVGSLPLAFHQRALAAEPLLVFRPTSLDASLAQLARLDVLPRAPALRLPGPRQAAIEAPEGTLLLLREAAP